MDYKKILEGVVNIINTTEKSDIGFVNICTYIGENCPELAESEDVRIRKELIEHCKNQAKPYIDTGNECPQIQSWIAWLEKQGENTNNWRPSKEQYEALDYAYNSCSDTEKGNYYEGVLETLIEDLHRLEKQGEQKPFDYESATIVQQDFASKVEPKFKIGDWVVDNCSNVWKIEGIINQFYFLEDVEGGESRPTIEWADKTFHLWTIQDAKDGDVLQLGEVTAIFKEFIGNGNCKCYCSVCKGEFEIPSQNGEDNSYGCHNATPATKEQHYGLMQVMNDAGYTFDFEKKKLKEIPCTLCCLTKLKEAMYDKPVCSEEDEALLKLSLENLIELKDKYGKDYGRVGNCINWLKSLKTKFNQNKMSKNL